MKREEEKLEGEYKCLVWEEKKFGLAKIFGLDCRPAGGQGELWSASQVFYNNLRLPASTQPLVLISPFSLRAFFKGTVAPETLYIVYKFGNKFEIWK